MGFRSFLACAVLVLGATARADGTGYEEPWNAFRAGDYAGSAAGLAALLTANPGWVDGHLLSGQCSYLLGDPAGAERAIDRALELDPAADAFAAYLRAGRLLYTEHRFVEAVRPLELAVELAEPDKRRATVEQLAFAYFKAERPAEARRALEEAVADGFDAETAWYLALVCQREGDYPRALELLERLRAAGVTAERETKAIRYLAEWSRYWALAPENAGSRDALLAVALAHGRAWFLAAPDDPTALSNYGETSLEAGRAQDLLDELRPRIDGGAASCAERLLVVRALMQLSRWDDAAEQFPAAVSCSGSAESYLLAARVGAGSLSSEHSSLEEVRRDQAIAQDALAAFDRAEGIEPALTARFAELREGLVATLAGLGESAGEFERDDAVHQDAVTAANLESVRQRCLAIAWSLRDETREVSAEDRAFYEEHDCRSFSR